jgi:hypothetical protein
MSPPTFEVARYRAEISRILASSEFASSRQLQDFLRYTSEKAASGATHLEQIEIARAVLGRGDDFNPVEDASVRKMASQIRQRLEQYYARNEGVDDLVLVLPVRSYVPRLEHRATPARPAPTIMVETAPASPEQSPIAETSHSRLLRAGLVAGLTFVAAWLAFRYYPTFRQGTGAGSAPIILSTVKGDIIQGGTFAPGPGVQLGPGLGEVDEITVRLSFTPNMEAQQAGLIVWQDIHHFIRLGRKFVGRNQIEFLLEQGNSAITTPANTVYDGDGQSGQPLWLCIRRDRNEYRAYLSRDGLRWEQHGEPIVPAVAFAAPRGGIFALNGRRDAPSIPASFSHLSTGVTFAALPNPSIEPYSRSGWSTTQTCPESINTGIEGPTLRIAFRPNQRNCAFEISRPLSGRDWELTTRMDFLPAPGRSAGLRVAGSKASIRLARYTLNGPAIAFIHDGRTLIGRPDLNGSPAIYLRLRLTAGVLSAAFSADGERFELLPVNVNVDELGSNIRGGLRFTTTTTDQEEPPSIIRFYWFREGIRSLTEYR